MARKFKKGDKVRILKRVGAEKYVKGFRAGMKGIVEDYFPDDYPYCVKKLNDKGYANFMAQELELVERKIND